MVNKVYAKKVVKVGDESSNLHNPTRMDIYSNVLAVSVGTWFFSVMCTDVTKWLHLMLIFVTLNGQGGVYPTYLIYTWACVH